MADDIDDLTAAVNGSTSVAGQFTALEGAVGDRLRHHRLRQDLSRRQLADEMGGRDGVAAQTLLSYELNSRHVPLYQFVRICHALGVPAHALLREAERQVFHGGDGMPLPIDLVGLAAGTQSALYPARRWAQQLLRGHDPRSRPVKYVSQLALPALAELCGTTTSRLIEELQPFLDARRR